MYALDVVMKSLPNSFHVRALLTTTAITVISNTMCCSPAELDAPIVTKVAPCATVGVPLISPVVGFKETPVGKLPDTIA